MGQGSPGTVSLADQPPPVCRYTPQAHRKPESHPGALSGHLAGDAGAGLKEMNLTGQLCPCWGRSPSSGRVQQEV